MKPIGSLSIVCGLWLALVIGCSNPNSPSVESSSPTQSASPQNTVTQQTGWNPQEACAYLSHISGLQTRGYKNQYENTYGCSSPYKELGVGSPLANNIAYYVEGNSQNAAELKLVLNVNAAQESKDAHATLLNYSEELTKKALGTPLPKDVRNAISSGKAGQWTIEKSKVELMRDVWPTGRGYELHYIIRKEA